MTKEEKAAKAAMQAKIQKMTKAEIKARVKELEAQSDVLEDELDMLEDFLADGMKPKAAGAKAFEDAATS